MNNNLYTENLHHLPLGCNGCIILGLCGGTKSPLLGSNACYVISKEAEQYDDEMSPNNPHFWKIWDDVHGLHDWKFDRFCVPAEHDIPTYIPVIKNGSRRSTSVNQEIVALPFFKVFGKRLNGSYGSHYEDGSDLRRKFKIREDARIILIGVHEDPQLELLWKKHRVSNISEELQRLNIYAVTTPNFSAFSDAPKFQIFANLKRSLMIASMLSNGGIPVVPHLTAIDPSQWKLWRKFLKEHPEIQMICQEFQTGFKDTRKGIEVLDEISRIQKYVNRPIHPILVGGGKFYEEAARRFENFTIVDSRPHMLSMSRLLLRSVSPEIYEKISVNTLPGHSLDTIYQQNIDVHSENVRLGRRKRRGRKDSCHPELDLNTSTPYLIAQPAA